MSPKTDNVATGEAVRLWWMNDNHTFVELRNDNLEDTCAHVLECWARDPWGMLCGCQPKPSEDLLPGRVHGQGIDKREAFAAEARAWLAPFGKKGAAHQTSIK